MPGLGWDPHQKTHREQERKGRRAPALSSSTGISAGSKGGSTATRREGRRGTCSLVLARLCCTLRLSAAGRHGSACAAALCLAWGAGAGDIGLGPSRPALRVCCWPHGGRHPSLASLHDSGPCRHKRKQWMNPSCHSLQAFLPLTLLIFSRQISNKTIWAFQLW